MISLERYVMLHTHTSHFSLLVSLLPPWRPPRWRWLLHFAALPAVFHLFVVDTSLALLLSIVDVRCDRDADAADAIRDTLTICVGVGVGIERRASVSLSFFPGAGRHRIFSFIITFGCISQILLSPPAFAILLPYPSSFAVAFIKDTVGPRVGHPIKTRHCLSVQQSIA